MTLHLVDVSRHQAERADPLDPAAAKRAGFGALNVQLDRGRQDDVLPAWSVEYAIEARRLGMGVSTYRWLDARIGGAESARRAFDRLQRIGLERVAHVVDCEDTASAQHLRDYVTTMVGLLGRPVAIYSGRWWLRPRGWRTVDLSPYLWAAPAAGYLGSYPGDTSAHWSADYGGYTQLSAMQYAVVSLPGTGPCSLSAIRDPAVWSALTGGGMRALNLQALTSGILRLWPGATVWGKGDPAHQLSPSDHNEDDTAGSKPEQQDADSNPEHRAIDVPTQGPITMPILRDLRARITDRPANRQRCKYVILEQNIWRKNGGWVREDYAGEFHDHLHVSGDAAYDELATAWDIADAPAPREDDDMQPVLIKLAGEDTVRLVTMGVGHIPLQSPEDLARWRSFMSANSMNTAIYEWAADWRPQCGPDLTAVPTLAMTPEMATAIAQQIIAAGSNDLSDADLDTIRDLVVEGSKQAAREGTGA